MAKTQAFRRLASEQMLLPASITGAGEAARGARPAILTTALKLFAERGFGGTSVRDIAAAAQIQPATLYAHFPSKQHVLAELIELGHQEHQKWLREALLESGNDPVEQVAALVRAHVGMHAAYPMLAVVSNSELHSLEPEFAGATLALRQQSEQLFAGVFKRGAEQGVFDVGHPFLALAWIAGAGLRVANWYTESFELSASEVADQYVELAWRVLGVKKKS